MEMSFCVDGSHITVSAQNGSVEIHIGKSAGGCVEVSITPFMAKIIGHSFLAAADEIETGGKL